MGRGQTINPIAQLVHDHAREAPGQGFDEAAKRRSQQHPPKLNCTLATVQQQSRWKFRRLPKTCPMWLGQNEAHRDSTSMAQRGGAHTEAHSGEDSHRGRTLRKHLTSERSDMFDEGRELLLCAKLWIRVQNGATSCALAEVEGK